MGKGFAGVRVEDGSATHRQNTIDVRQGLGDDFTFETPKLSLSVREKNVGHGFAGPLLDSSIAVAEFHA